MSNAAATPPGPDQPPGPAQPDDAMLVVFCTFPNADEAARVANVVVSEGLAACVNILRDIRSIYFWNDQVVNSAETLCLIKTARTRFDDLVARLSDLHPYDVPEIVAVRPTDVNQPYLRWVLNETSSSRGG